MHGKIRVRYEDARTDKDTTYMTSDVKVWAKTQESVQSDEIVFLLLGFMHTSVRPASL